MITHKGKTYHGLHQPIVDEALFAAVQSKLDAQARCRADRRQENAAAPLTGRLFDEDGQPMSPTTAYGRHGKRYRYYVSAPLQQGRAIEETAKAQRRVLAPLLEDRLRALVQSVTRGSSADPLVHLLRVEVHDHALHVTLPADQVDQTRASADPHLTVARDLAKPEALRLTVPARIHCSAGRSWIIGGGPPKARPDRALINALRSAHTMVSLERSGLPRIETSPVSPYHRRLVRLAFLAPELQRAILLGRQPPGLTLQYLMDSDIPADWEQQAALFERPTAL